MFVCMRGLIVDYYGVLNGTDDEAKRWRELLKAVNENGVATAVLSNDPGGPGADPIREFETSGLVDSVILSGEIGADKPEGRAFEIAAERLGLSPRDCVMVDDSIENIHGAVEKGMVGVFYQQFDRSVVEITGLFGLEGDF